MFTPQSLYQILDDLAVPSQLWVAYSGGLDSHVLLHALAKLRVAYPQLSIRAVHINHGLSPNAAYWSGHCQQICGDLNIDCVIQSINPTIYGNKANLEEVAREQRYEIFASLLKAGECLLTAHHRDDQAETLLLRLLRGAGTKGLSAMRAQRPLGQGVLFRPLLTIARVDLEAYAKRENLQWIEDESNACTQLDRNYLRQTIMPQFKTRWPQVAATLARTASHCQQAGELLAERAAEDIRQAQGSVVNTLSIAALKKLSPIRQKNLLRYWLENLGFSLPSGTKLAHLQLDCVEAKQDAVPLLAWGKVEVRRFDDNLYAMSALAAHDASLIIPWDLQQPLVLPAQLGQLRAKTSENGIYLPTGAAVTIRFRQGGERFQPAGRVGSHPLKKLWQQWQVPPWLRERIPLIYVDEQLALIPGYAIAEYYAHAHRRGQRVMVEFDPG